MEETKTKQKKKNIFKRRFMNQENREKKNLLELKTIATDI